MVLRLTTPTAVHCTPIRVVLFGPRDVRKVVAEPALPQHTGRLDELDWVPFGTAAEELDVLLVKSLAGIRPSAS